MLVHQRVGTPKDMMYQDVSHMDIDGYYCLIFFDILQDAVSFWDSIALRCFTDW